MPPGANRSVSVAVRLAMWIMPPHRQEWARAMLNECAYIESRAAAVRWIIESILLAIKERTLYQLETISMNIKAFNAALLLAASVASVVVGIYAIQKPYQQERIKFALCRLLDAKQT